MLEGYTEPGVVVLEQAEHTSNTQFFMGGGLILFGKASSTPGLSFTILYPNASLFAPFRHHFAGQRFHLEIFSSADSYSVYTLYMYL